MSNYLTIDVGGTYIKYAVMTETPEILEKGETPTPEYSFEEFKKSLISIYEQYKDRDIKAVCMSAPGRINSDTGYFHTSGALGYVSGINLCDELRDSIPVPFSVENDAKAAALAELWKGSMKGYDSGSVITLGTGIGGSVIINGKLLRGTNYAAGEFSGISSQWNEKYSQGNVWAGCASTKSLVRMYSNEKNVPSEDMNGRTFFEAVRQQDEDALEILDQFCDNVVCGIMSLQLIMDVQRFSIGGGISTQPILIETINRKLDELFEENKGKTPASRPEVVACTFGNDANMIGALYHYLYELKK